MIYFGQDKISELHYSGKEIKEMYLGNTMMYQNKHPLFLTLETDGHGTLSADVLSGFAGDTVTLAPTYNTYYRFSGYDCTGGTIEGNTFTFGNQNATAKVNFQLNSFIARGNLNWTNNFNGSYQGVQQAYPALAITGWTGISPSSTMTGGQGTNFGATGTNKAGNLTGNRGWKDWTPANGLRAPVNCSSWRLSGVMNITGQHNAYGSVFTSVSERTLTAGINCVGTNASPARTTINGWFNTNTNNKTTSFTFNATAEKYGTATNLGSYGFYAAGQNWASVTQGDWGCYSWAYHRILGVGGSWYASGIMP